MILSFEKKFNPWYILSTKTELSPFKVNKHAHTPTYTRARTYICICLDILNSICHVRLHPLAYGLLLFTIKINASCNIKYKKKQPKNVFSFLAFISFSRFIQYL